MLKRAHCSAHDVENQRLVIVEIDQAAGVVRIEATALGNPLEHFGAREYVAGETVERRDDDPGSLAGENEVERASEIRAVEIVSRAILVAKREVVHERQSLASGEGFD